MKAIILAAGSGTRLRPLTDNTPKCLLPIRGIPLLQIWLEKCRAAGISDVLVNAHSHAEMFHDFAGKHSGAVRVQVAEEQQLLGSAGTLFENRRFVGGEKAFFVLYGDVLTTVCLARMLSFHRRKKATVTLGICQALNPNACGIVTVDQEGVVRSFVEKPLQSPGNWAFAGIMVASPRLIDLVPAQRPADIGFHLLPQLNGQMTAYPILEYLLDIGTLSNYQAAQSSWPGLRGASVQRREIAPDTLGQPHGESDRI